MILEQFFDLLIIQKVKKNESILGGEIRQGFSLLFSPVFSKVSIYYHYYSKMNTL